MNDYSHILGNLSKEKFRQAINRLLNECFILKKSSDTKAEYRYIYENRDVFEGVLDLLGYELVIRNDIGVISINNPTGTGRIRFSKLESILALILRLLYIEKMKELSQVQDAIITIEDIYEKYNMLKIQKLRKDLLTNALRKFKRINLIQNLDRMDNNCGIETRILIYPSVLLAITAVNLDDMYKTALEKLNEFANGGETDDTNGTDDEAFNEDTAD